MKPRISPKSFRRFSRPPKPAKPNVFGNLESIKNKFTVYEIYRFQNFVPIKHTLEYRINGGVRIIGGVGNGSR